MAPVKKGGLSPADLRREKSIKRLTSHVKVLLRVAVYSVLTTLAVYLFALALFLLAPSVGQAQEVATGSASGMLPAGLSEDSATTVNIARLASADTTIDSTLVTFSGEAVGEAVNSLHDGSKWVLMQSQSGSQTSSIEVLMTDDQVALIQNWGAYKVKGTTVRVTGIYRVADSNNTGELDVTAYVVSVVDVGGYVGEGPLDMRLFWTGIVLAMLGVVFTGVNVYLRRRSRS